MKKVKNIYWKEYRSELSIRGPSFSLSFVFAVVVQNLLHLVNFLLVVRLVEDLLATVSDQLLEHLFLFTQKELKPEAFSLSNDFDVECLVDVGVLLLDEIVEVVCLVVELELPPESILQLPELVD